MQTFVNQVGYGKNFMVINIVFFLRSTAMRMLGTRKARAKRCGMCDQCMRGDCNHCKDMTEFGGSRKSKQACVERKYSNMGV